jgi:hypothetical protein
VCNLTDAEVSMTIVVIFFWHIRSFEDLHRGGTLPHVRIQIPTEGLAMMMMMMMMMMTTIIISGNLHTKVSCQSCCDRVVQHLCAWRTRNTCDAG